MDDTTNNTFFMTAEENVCYLAYQELFLPTIFMPPLDFPSLYDFIAFSVTWRGYKSPLYDSTSIEQEAENATPMHYW
jgi:hypothetical protein